MSKLLILIIFVSCATKASEWYEVAPSFDKQTWRICSEERDGKEKALTGFCYISKLCKDRFLRSRVCKPLPKYIPFTDKIGITKLMTAGKVLRRR